MLNRLILVIVTIIGVTLSITIIVPILYWVISGKSFFNGMEHLNNILLENKKIIKKAEKGKRMN